MIDFQRAASEQGKQFMDDVVMALRYAGFEIIQREFPVPDVGITLDLHVRNAYDIDFLVECKGSMRGARPGCKRTDTTKKALANAYLLRLSQIAPHFPPMLLLTSHIADSGDARAMLEQVPVSDVLDVLNPWEHSKQLNLWAFANHDAIQRHVESSRTIGQLLRLNWK